MERGSLWCKVLFSKYGPSLGLSQGIASRSSFSKHSSWVRDLDLVFHKESVKDHWYRRLFTISTTPNDNICSFGSWAGDLWKWNFTWRRQLFYWELDMLTSLLDDLKSVSLQRHSYDICEWWYDSSKIFTVKSA
ncbi:hypothetical protein Lal_00004442 [Lupinus albus]|nr:hypothetical protein Lal_00004442 [Lupinus albus]